MQTKTIIILRLTLACYSKQPQNKTGHVCALLSD
jgi:hypothetical protein